MNRLCNSNECCEAVLESLAGSIAMPFIDTSALDVIERLPGWYGSWGSSKAEDLLDTSIKLEQPGDYRVEEGLRANLTFDKTRGVAMIDGEFQVSRASKGLSRVYAVICSK